MNRPVAALPEPFPDETLHSLITRYHLLAADRDDATTLTRLFASRHDVPAAVLPSRPDALLRATGQSDFAYTAYRLTLYPFFRPFLAPETAAQVERAMRDRDGRCLSLLSGRPRGGIGSARALRYCPACLVADRATHGVAYWHRSHQLPGVLVCHRHPDQWLHDHAAPAHATLRHALYLPEMRARHASANATGAVPPPVADIARVGHQVLIADLPTLGRVRLVDAYPRRLLALELTTDSGRVRHAAFFERYRGPQHYKAFHALALLPESRTDWLATFFRTPRCGKHATKHVLVIAWLFARMDALLEVVSATSEPRGEGTAAREREAGQDDAQALQELLHVKRCSLRQAATRLGTSVATASVRAQALGIAFGRRRKRTSASGDQRLRELLLDGFSPQAIAERVGLSVVTVNRVRRATPGLSAMVNERHCARLTAEHRARVRVLLEASPAGRITEFRTAHPDLYTWCYRHDHDWFQAQFPAAKLNRNGGGVVTGRGGMRNSPRVYARSQPSATPTRGVRVASLAPCCCDASARPQWSRSIVTICPRRVEPSPNIRSRSRMGRRGGFRGRRGNLRAATSRSPSGE